MNNNVYMDVRMVSEYLHVARSTIYKWVEDDFIPHKKLGKRVLFVKEHIDRWVMNDGMIINDLPEVPQFKVIVKNPPAEIRIKSNNHGHFPLRA